MRSRQVLLCAPRRSPHVRVRARSSTPSTPTIRTRSPSLSTTESLFSDEERAPYVSRQIEKLDRYVDDDAAAIPQDPKSEGLRCYGKAPKRPRVLVRRPCCDPN